MALRPDILTPIAGDSPSGVWLRYESVYDEIKEARREQEAVSGDWATPGKSANYDTVIALAEEALATQTKDLQLAVWLADALVRRKGFAAFGEALALCKDLIETFWDTLHPLPDADDGSLDGRAAPLVWIGAKMDSPIKMRPLCAAGYSWFAYRDAQLSGYEKSGADEYERKERREGLEKSGKIALEDFDKSLAATPTAFYVQLTQDLDACLKATAILNDLCNDRFQDAAPSLAGLTGALEDVARNARLLLKKKQELDPVAAASETVELAGASATEPTVAGPASSSRSGPPSIVIPLASTEPPERRAAIAAIAAAAAELRRQNPRGPAPYLMMRGLRWGELREATAALDPRWLEAPPMELRQRVKTLALAGQWRELLETAENAMSLPCSRGWLDLQRFVVEACMELGADYHEIARAIQGHLRMLIVDVPQILDATLTDDTPAANPRTRAWIADLMKGAAVSEPLSPDGGIAGDGAWRRNFVDSRGAAIEAVADGQPGKAIGILQTAIDRERSGRGRFLKKMDFVEVCATAQKIDLAQPALEDIEKALTEYKLDEWEDRDMMVDALVLLMKHSQRLAGEKERLFERICRLDPARAMNLS